MYNGLKRLAARSLSLYFWERLQDPPTRNPVFRRYLKQSQRRGCLYPFELLVYGGGMFVLLMSAVYPPATAVVVFAGAMTLMLWHATFSPLGWITGTSAMIVRLRQRSEYDLLAVIPPGRLAIYWGACCSQWEADRSYVDRPLIIRLTIGMTLIVLAGSILLLTCVLFSQFSLFRGIDISQVVTVYTLVLIALAWGYLNYIQSLVMGGLLAIIIAYDSRDASVARIWGVGVFLLIQFSLYVLIALFLTLWTYWLSIGTSMLTQGVILVVFIVVFAAVREMIVWVLWWQIKNRLNTELGELAQLV